MARVSIEDCKKNMANRFALVVVAANRARQLMGNSTPLVNSKNKEVVVALREIAEGKVLMKGELGGEQTQDSTQVDLSDFLENAVEDSKQIKKELDEKQEKSPKQEAGSSDPSLPASE